MKDDGLKGVDTLVSRHFEEQRLFLGAQFDALHRRFDVVDERLEALRKRLDDLRGAMPVVRPPPRDDGSPF